MPSSTSSTRTSLNLSWIRREKRMAMIHLDLNPSAEKIRQFGIISPIMLVGIGLLLMWRFELPLIWPLALGGIGVTLLILSRISHVLVRPFYLGLVIIGFPIGWVISHLIMTIFFFGILAPIALIFRITGRDALQRKRDDRCKSYWTGHTRSDNTERFFRQF